MGRTSCRVPCMSPEQKINKNKRKDAKAQRSYIFSILLEQN